MLLTDLKFIKQMIYVMKIMLTILYIYIDLMRECITSTIEAIYYEADVAECSSVPDVTLNSSSFYVV